MLATFVDRALSPGGKKAIKYTLVSAISVAVSQVVFLGVYGLYQWTATSASLLATSVGAVPSYVLNRRWAWGKTGRSHLWKEVVPFWVLAFVSLGFSTFTSSMAESYIHEHHELSRTWQTLIVNGAYLGGFFVLWIGKFVIFNKLIFIHDEDLRAALADEVVG
jgi:putative flippase GtrA